MKAIDNDFRLNNEIELIGLKRGFDMLKFIGFFLLSVGAFAQVNPSQLYIAKSSDGEKFLLSEASPFNISGKLDNTALGLCLRTCSKSFIMSEAFSYNLALSNGVLEIPESIRSSYTFPSYFINTESTMTQVSDSIFNVTSEAKMDFAGSNVSMGKQEFILEKIPVTIEFNHSEVSTSNRQNYNEVSDDLKLLSSSVFQVIGVEESSGLSGSGSSTGTGFFISNNGYALTNLHVMETNPLCLSKRSCILTIKQKNNFVKEYKLPTRVLTCSKFNDFCLIKINLQNDLSIKPLEIGLRDISQNLMTLGFPADKESEFLNVDGESVTEISLTYSFGSPVGLSGTGVSSSLFIYSGASGSPIIDMKTGKVIGLNSNGAQTFSVGTDGVPAIFRSLFVIDKEFDLMGYLNNDKQSRIDALILKLQTTKKLTEAASILMNIKNEKSFYGRGKLEVMSYKHQVPEIRKFIFKFLKAAEAETL